MKQFFKTVGLAALLSATVMAQSTTGNANYNPANIMWWIEAMVYAMYAACIAIAILWKCLHGALGTHQGFGEIVNVLIYGSLGFSVVFVITRMVVGVVGPALGGG